MKQSEVDTAVKWAREYLSGAGSLGYCEIDEVCKALVALNDDDVDDDEEDEPYFPVTQANVACLESTEITDEDVRAIKPPDGNFARFLRAVLRIAS